MSIRKNKFMKVSQKIILNTIVLYVKLIVTIFLTLFSTRIVLLSLGVEDFGLYNLIAGVIAFLSFLNSAMMTSTQRFLSVGMGRGVLDDLRAIFATSLTIHILIGMSMFVFLLLFIPLLINGTLSIPQEKISIALDCYVIMIFSVLITVFAVPFNAVINSHEDMWYFAIIETIAALLKLGAAYFLYYVESDKLQIYCYLMLIIIAAGALSKVIWSYLKYEEPTINIFKYSTKVDFNKMIRFVSWNSLGSLAQVGRNQGVAIVLNIFFGVTVNAAYAVTNQVNSFLTYFSHILTSTFAPQIMKSKGENNIERMIFISVLASKLAFILTSFTAIFLLTDLPLILKMWLKEVPADTLEFCYYSIWIFLVMQLYPGLVRMIQANGKIRNYQIITSLLLLLTLPLGYLCFRMGARPVSIFCIMLILQILALLATLYFSKILCGLSVKKYVINSIFVPISLFVVVLLLSKTLYVHISCPQLMDLLILSGSANIVLAGLFYVFVLNKKEKQLAHNVVKYKRKVK